jgi:hypothetical protein
LRGHTNPAPRPYALTIRELVPTLWKWTMALLVVCLLASMAIAIVRLT